MSFYKMFALQTCSGAKCTYEVFPAQRWFLFLAVSHNQCSQLPTVSARSQHICLGILLCLRENWWFAVVVGCQIWLLPSLLVQEHYLCYVPWSKWSKSQWVNNRYDNQALTSNQGIPNKCLALYRTKHYHIVSELSKTFL